MTAVQRVHEYCTIPSERQSSPGNCFIFSFSILFCLLWSRVVLLWFVFYSECVHMFKLCSMYVQYSEQELTVSVGEVLPYAFPSIDTENWRNCGTVGTASDLWA